MTDLVALRPSPTSAAAGAERDELCAHYDDCLDQAVKRGWPGFTCRECALRGRVQGEQRDAMLARATQVRENRMEGGRGSRQVEAYKTPAGVEGVRIPGAGWYSKAGPAGRLVLWAKRSGRPFTMAEGVRAAELSLHPSTKTLIDELVERGYLRRLRSGVFEFARELAEPEGTPIAGPPASRDSLDDLHHPPAASAAVTTTRRPVARKRPALPPRSIADESRAIPVAGRPGRPRKEKPMVMATEVSALERARDFRKQQELLKKDLFRELAYHDGRAAEIREVLVALGEGGVVAEDRSPVPATRPRRRVERAPKRKAAPSNADIPAAVGDFAGRIGPKEAEVLKLAQQAKEPISSADIVAGLKGVSLGHAHQLVAKLAKKGLLERSGKGHYAPTGRKAA